MNIGDMKSETQDKFDSYPEHIKLLMLRLRELVYSVAEDLSLGDVEENLKWGEPSFQTRGGSPVRMDWKPRFPQKYFLFFHCQTKLVDTFRELYSDTLEFEGNRAIVLYVDQELPEKTIKHCLQLAMTYKSIKHLPLLGA
jgi:hypothetical protein